MGIDNRFNAEMQEKMRQKETVSDLSKEELEIWWILRALKRYEKIN